MCACMHCIQLCTIQTVETQLCLCGVFFFRLIFSSSGLSQIRWPSPASFFLFFIFSYFLIYFLYRSEYSIQWALADGLHLLLTCYWCVCVRARGCVFWCNVCYISFVNECVSLSMTACIHNTHTACIHNAPAHTYSCVCTSLQILHKHQQAHKCAYNSALTQS